LHLENYADDIMDDLLVKYLAEEATPPEQEMVEVWIKANDNNKKYFRHFQTIWNESQKLASRSSIDENKAWHRFQRKVKKSETAASALKGFGWWRVAAVIVIIAGIAFKFLSLWYTRSKDTYSGTHVRIDALAWGVLLNLLLVYYPQLLKRKGIYILTILGALIAGTAIMIYLNTESIYFKKVVGRRHL